MRVNHRIHLCLAKMSDTGLEQKYIQEAFSTNWVAPLGPNVDGFEEDLGGFFNGKTPCIDSLSPTSQRWNDMHGGGINAGPCIDSSASARAVSRNDMHGRSPFWPCHSEGGFEGGEESMARKTKESITSGTYHVAALSSCTAAIHVALLLLGVEKDDEVLCQSFSFCASANPVVYCGANPVFVDSEEETWNMSPALLEEAIQDRIAKTGRKPKAIIVVDLYGMPAKWDEIEEIAQRYGIPVIEDAANALGSYYKGKPCGTFGDIATLSFNGNKMITTSGGGALVCKDEETKKRAIFLATQAKEPCLHYEHEVIGYNYRMSNICAGIGRGQMTVLEDHVRRHKHVHERYKERFQDIDGIAVHDNPGGEYDSNFWLTTVTFENEMDVEALCKVLDQAGIEARPLWKPMHLQPVYRNAPAFIHGVCERLYKTGICLPSGPWVSDEDVEFIVETILQQISRP